MTGDGAEMIFNAAAGADPVDMTVAVHDHGPLARKA